MNILKIFNDVRKLPIKPHHLKLIYEAYNIFKGKNLKGNPSEIDEVLSQLGMKRKDLSELLPYLNRPSVSNALETIMPNSVGNLKSLVDYLGKTDTNNINNNNINNSNNNHNNNFKFPRLS